MEVICGVCCNGVIVCILKLHDGGVAKFAFGLELVEVEEPVIRDPMCQ